MNGDVRGRIIEYIGLKGYSVYAFSHQIGITPSVIQSMIDKGTQPSVKTILAVLNGYPSLSAEWLMRGVGEMEVDIDATIARKGEHDLRDYVAHLEEEVARLNRIIDALITR